MIEKEFDVVVVGSGAGGGAAAKELAPLCREGLSVAVLEWGPKFREEEYTGRELEMAGKLYFDGGGVLNAEKTMTIAAGKAYGGSTVVYTGTSIKLPKASFERWGVPGLDYEDISRRTDKYKEENGVHLQPPELINDNNRLFREACEKLGYHVAQFPINVRGCRGSGLCNLGCPNQAKQGTHRVQLPEAERGGVQVITKCRVDRLGERELFATVVESEHGEPSPWAPGEYRIRAKAVVLAAGVLNTPALLLRSGYGGRLPALGRYFTCQPALIMAGRHKKPITNYHGHPKSYYSEEFAQSKRFLLETCMYFPFTTAKNLAGFGPGHAGMVSAMDRLQMILVLAIDEARRGNRIDIDASGKPLVRYAMGPEVLDAFTEAMKICAKLFFAAGCEAVSSPASKDPLIPASEAGRLDELIVRDELKPGKLSVAAAHLMGGCRMGAGTADSVTDARGRVHGVPWLFVADASLFPKAAGINPYLTIMALADRTAETVRSEIGALRAAAGGIA